MALRSWHDLRRASRPQKRRVSPNVSSKFSVHGDRVAAAGSTTTPWSLYRLMARTN
jgi:hypothetical protein